MASDKQLTTDKAVDGAGLPVGKSKHRYSCGDGLVLEVRKAKQGLGKYWVYPYRSPIDGKRKDASLGRYLSTGKPGHVGLRAAKQAMAKLKEQIGHSIDPNYAKKAEKAATIASQKEQAKEQAAKENTYETIARRWHSMKEAGWAPKNATQIIKRQMRYVFPHIGHIPVTELTREDTSQVIARIRDRGHFDLAGRVYDKMRAVLDYACDYRFIEDVPMVRRKNVLPPELMPKPKPMPAITDLKGIRTLLLDIDAFEKVDYLTKKGLQLLPLVMLRNKEFRCGKWEDIELDGENPMWTVPALDRKLKQKEKLDPKNSFLVPLSRQAVAILRELKDFAGTNPFVFPSVRAKDGYISENTINNALKRLGYDGEMVGHGWRSSFSTVMNERGYNRDAIERQLAHVEKNAVRKAYNRAEYIEERQRILQDWADLLDGLRDHG